jgi:predicted acetyltransferase
LLIRGGHIGYGIRPSERRKGYASRILALAVLKAREMNIQEILVTCSKDNTGSAKTILNNGGILWKEHLVDGVWTQNYWIKY